MPEIAFHASYQDMEEAIHLACKKIESDFHKLKLKTLFASLQPLCKSCLEIFDRVKLLLRWINRFEPVSGPEASTGVKFYEHDVCKSFLYECCPHEILASTV